MVTKSAAQPITDELTVEKVRDYLADLPDNASRLTTIAAESDATVTTTNNGDTALRLSKTIFQVEQEYFTFVSIENKAWYVRAATPDERLLLP